jgi:hypothetical protein
VSDLRPYAPIGRDEGLTNLLVEAESPRLLGGIVGPTTSGSPSTPPEAGANHRLQRRGRGSTLTDLYLPKRAPTRPAASVAG